MVLELTLNEEPAETVVDRAKTVQILNSDWQKRSRTHSLSLSLTRSHTRARTLKNQKKKKKVRERVHILHSLPKSRGESNTKGTVPGEATDRRHFFLRKKATRANSSTKSDSLLSVTESFSTSLSLSLSFSVPLLHAQVPSHMVVSRCVRVCVYVRESERTRTTRSQTCTPVGSAHSFAATDIALESRNVRGRNRKGGRRGRAGSAAEGKPTGAAAAEGSWRGGMDSPPTPTHLPTQRPPSENSGDRSRAVGAAEGRTIA